MGRILGSIGGMGLVAVAAAVFVVSFLALQAVGSASRPPEVELLAAARDLSPGDILTESDLQILRAFQDETTETFLPADVLTRTVGGMVAWPIRAGRPIPADAVIAPSGSRFAALLANDPGHAALPIALDEGNLIAPPPAVFRPGDLVDLVVVVSTEPPRPEPPPTLELPALSPLRPTPPVTPLASLTATAPISLRVPVAKSLFPQGARVLAVIAPGTDPETGAPDPGRPTLVLRVPAAELERTALLLRLADRVAVVHLGKAEGFPGRTPAFTYDDFIEWISREREEIRKEGP